ncbi:prolipoprotein diacylglyceryl transferase [Rhodococcus sp. ARC_M12]|uniref:prolipoprotein diacylglyceryl transferase n=1 Tax=Rhodococcus sp. ARC_M12 TaxID=2928854 RepID=UPI001FB23046|nr:prolipoprotein diacylglyceryl transferase [Rhodococcus sp. ARC_M12]MCJ0978175.1 prolipoprotein diacylglyceryl transferase [Rhodococcus sp. ARC_M12]
MTSTAILAYIPSPPQGVWHVGPLALRAYALFIIIGIVVAVVWGDRRWVARGGTKGTVLDVAVWAVPFGLLGGRLYHVATDWKTYFGPGGNPIEALYVWNGGLGIWGAVFLGGVGAWIACRRRGIPLPAFGDAVGPPILLAQAIGRIGNYFNQELYGRATTQPWGLEIYERVDADGRLDPLNGVSTGFVERVVHPTFLYELLWSVAIVVLLVLVDRKYRIGHGRLFALYVAGYCAGRFWVELMRDDFATEIAGIRINSFTSAIIFVLALAYVVIATKGREEPATLRSNDDEDRTSEAAAEGTSADGSPRTSVHDTTDADAVDAKPVQASDKKAEEEGSTRG